MELASNLYGIECEFEHDLYMNGTSIDVYLLLRVLKEQIENENIILQFSDIENNRMDYLEKLSESILNIIE